MVVTGRWALVYGIYAYSYARPDGKGKVFKESTGWTAFMTATIITAAVYAAFIPLIGFSAFIAGAAAFIVVMASAFCFSRRFSGLTGDTYGALNEIGELMVLVVVTILTMINLI